MDARDRINNVSSWNEWRASNPSNAWWDYCFSTVQDAWRHVNRPNLSKMDLRGRDLTGMNLEACILRGADLKQAILDKTNLDFADLSYCILDGASMQNCVATNTTFSEASLANANCSNSKFHGCNFQYSSLNGTLFCGSMITDCLVFGVSTWSVDLRNTIQRNLHISSFPFSDAGFLSGDLFSWPENVLTVDNLGLAYVLHSLANSSNPRELMDLLTTRIVLILGRFTKERKEILDNIRDDLSGSHLCPIIFDFEKPVNRTYTETIASLASIAKFILADVSDAKIVIQELHRIVPKFPSIPVQPICHVDHDINVIIDELNVYPWFLPVVRYRKNGELLESLSELLKEIDRFIESSGRR